jgi:hypothetical protein
VASAITSIKSTNACQKLALQDIVNVDPSTEAPHHYRRDNRCESLPETTPTGLADLTPCSPHPCFNGHKALAERPWPRYRGFESPPLPIHWSQGSLQQIHIFLIFTLNPTKGRFAPGASLPWYSKRAMPSPRYQTGMSRVTGQST